jgi:hypothetical protein
MLATTPAEKASTPPAKAPYKTIIASALILPLHRTHATISA